MLLTAAFPAAVASGAPTAMEVRLSVRPAKPRVGGLAQIELRTYAPFRRRDGSCCRLQPWDVGNYPFRVHAVSPTRRIFRVRVSRTSNRFVRRGSFRFTHPGAWTLRVANFGPSYRHAPGARPRLRVVVRPARRPPAGESPLGPLGGPGCDPPSPARLVGSGSGLPEVRATAAGGQLWALFFAGTWASRDAAIFQGIVGREVKIVWRMTGAGPVEFEATGPGGTRASPVWGPTPHISSNWRRPGDEWGTGFVFTSPGCWRIRATRGAVSGNVWLVVGS